MFVVDSRKSWIRSLRGKTHLCLSLCAFIASEKERERECNQAHLCRALLLVTRTDSSGNGFETGEKRTGHNL